MQHIGRYVLMDDAFIFCSCWYLSFFKQIFSSHILRKCKAAHGPMVSKSLKKCKWKIIITKNQVILSSYILINLPKVVFVQFIDKQFVNLRCFFRNTSQILFTIAYFPVPVIFARYSISGIRATYLYTISDFFFLFPIKNINVW